MCRLAMEGIRLLGLLEVRDHHLVAICRIAVCCRPTTLITGGEYSWKAKRNAHEIRQRIALAGDTAGWTV